MKLIWHTHVRSAHLASVHASVSNVFGEHMKEAYSVPVDAIWPPILWASAFRTDPKEVAPDAAELRQKWLGQLKQQGTRHDPPNRRDLATRRRRPR